MSCLLRKLSNRLWLNLLLKNQFALQLCQQQYGYNKTLTFSAFKMLQMSENLRHDFLIFFMVCAFSITMIQKRYHEHLSINFTMIFRVEVW